MNAFFRRIADWWHRDRLGRELDDELRFHRRMLERDQLAFGATTDRAARYASVRLGNVTSIKERSRDVWNPVWFDALIGDTRHALRVLRRHLAFTATVVVTLGLAVGANTLMLTIVDRTLLRPLPYQNPDGLVAAFHRDVKFARDDKATGAEVARWAALSPVFASVAFAWDAQYTMTSATPAVVLRGFQFSPNMFAVLGVHAAIGRTLAGGDEVPGSDHVVVLSDHLWRSAFAASRDVVGQVIRLDDAPYLVVGVMPASFAHPDATIDLWTPLAMPVGLASNNTLRAFNVVARLRDGVTAADARKRLPNDVRIESLRDVYLGPAKPVIWVLQGAVLLLVLIAGANVANLVLAHATTARREVALRHALGASRRRVIGGFVIQGVVLALLGCAVGIAVANIALSAIPSAIGRLFAGALPLGLDEGLAAGAVTTAIGTTIVLGIVIGLLMALSSRSAPGVGLRTDARAASTNPSVVDVRAAVIVVQIAVSLVLLASSALLVRSYLNLERRSLGFGTAGRLTFLLQPQANRYPDLPRMSGYVDEVLAKIRALPGVEMAAATSAVPLTGPDARRRLVIPGARDSADASVIHYRVVSPDYFATMAIRLRAGRSFSSDDRAAGLPVAVVNETLARSRWPGESPVGKTVTIAGGPVSSTAVIVGVVADVRHEGLAAEVQPELYRPIDQAFWPFVGIVAKTTTDPAAASKSVERAVWAVNASQPIEDVRTMDDVAAESVALRRVSMLVVSAFAIAAGLLSAVGIYGVIAYVVSLRTRELGIRVALGADPMSVMRHVVGSGARLALAGAAAGIGATLGVTHFLSALLFGVPPRDPSSVGAALVLTILVSLAASYFPARRASRIDPAITLRSE